MTGTCYTLEVQPRIPPRLNGLTELANDLFYSWDRQVRALFVTLDAELWESCGHNPKVFLRRISQDRLATAAQDRTFMEAYNRALSAYNTYHREHAPLGVSKHLDPNTDLVAYFCAEFGFHESLPIYSGGLGILAGDHCKAASDLSVPFVAMGLLYRQGYFTQTIDGQGNQIAHYTLTHFGDLPVVPACDHEGAEVYVHIALPGRRVKIKVWKAKAGHITLYLLDSDLPENQDGDRAITYQLYGGNIETRIQQEMVLGIGGVRALRALGLAPTTWHINEGHSAFQIIERCRAQVVEHNMEFDAALELVAASTVFTTHTPVPAGHDIFDYGMMRHYFGEFVRELRVGMDDFLRFGAAAGGGDTFNMTAFALRGSRFHNGVSRIHGSVASHMESYIWPQIPAEENPISYVTNGVHVPTFLAREWANLFDMRFGGEWRNELRNTEYWQCIDDIPAHSYWSLRQSLKSELMAFLRKRVIKQHQRNGLSTAHVERVARMLQPGNTEALIIGFARRFATYKRATLLFSDPERLARLLNDTQRPVLLVFAGKAHPRDLPGQQLIQAIHNFASRPEFEGRILLLEGYDLALGRKLVSSVDVWVNTPEYPLEASGTSGQKAGINGIINLSVLDGWWGEGCNDDNGWAITPHDPSYDAQYRDWEEGQELLDILEKQVIPMYFDRNGQGYSEAWVKKSKASMKSILPRFNSQRMVMDYVTGSYGPSTQHGKALASEGGAPARQLAAWKKKIHAVWDGVRARRIDAAPQEVIAGETVPVRIALTLNGLESRDIAVECLVGLMNDRGEFTVHEKLPLEAVGIDGHEAVYQLELRPSLSGLQYYKLRAYPHHALLAHPFETGRMLWI